ncbi:hypothetical protein [Undibacterium umbellatum]|nr:hypothetical protein [Undibacterium umbellatum]
MSPIFTKMNLKEQKRLLIVNAPASFQPVIDELAAEADVEIFQDIKKCKRCDFALAFVSKQDELDKISAALLTKIEGDALLWFAYPKGTSKKYKCAFNRDTGWDVIKGAGFDTVRMVAIDEDWSGLRFRHSDFIKNSSKKSAG